MVLPFQESGDLFDDIAQRVKSFIFTIVLLLALILIVYKKIIY